MLRFLVVDACVPPERDPMSDRLGRALLDRRPDGLLVLSNSTQVLGDLSTHSPDIVVVTAKPWSDVRALCRQVRNMTRNPLLLVGPEDVVGHLGSGADACVPRHTSTLVVVAYAEALLRRTSALEVPRLSVEL